MTMPLRMLGESALWVPKAENDQKKVKFIKMLIKVYVKPILIFFEQIYTHSYIEDFHNDKFIIFSLPT